jgi:hypothetical protein
MFENGVLRRIFVPTRDEMAERLKKLYKEDLHNLTVDHNNFIRFMINS